MYLSLTLASLLSIFTVIHAVPIQQNEVYHGEIGHRTLSKRNDYERGSGSGYNEGRYDRYNEQRYNPNFFRHSRPSYREYPMDAYNRMYSPQYYTQTQSSNVYSEAEMQNYIAAAAVAAANAVATSNSATPATPGAAAPATDTLTYEAMLTSSDPQVLFGNSQSDTANPQPASSFTFPGFNTGANPVANPVANPAQAKVAPPPKA